MQKTVFSSAELPTHLDDRARFSLWRELYRARYGLLDIQRAHERPFSAHFTFVQFAGLGLGQFGGTVDRVDRTRREVAQSPSDNFCLVINRGGSTMSFAHRGREAVLAPGAATLFNEAEPGSLGGQAENAWFALVVAPRPLNQLVANAEDLSGRLLDGSLPALRHLRRTLETPG